MNAKAGPTFLSFVTHFSCEKLLHPRKGISSLAKRLAGLHEVSPALFRINRPPSAGPKNQIRRPWHFWSFFQEGKLEHSSYILIRGTQVLWEEGAWCWCGLNSSTKSQPRKSRGNYSLSRDKSLQSSGWVRNREEGAEYLGRQEGKSCTPSLRCPCCHSYSEAAKIALFDSVWLLSSKKERHNSRDSEWKFRVGQRWG